MKKKNKETEEEQGAADMVDLLFSCTNVRRENKYFKPEVLVESMPWCCFIWLVWVNRLNDNQDFITSKSQKIN